MNQVIETILDHRSVRSFQDRKLSREQVETIVRSAQSASTSSFIQAYTIIGVTDQEKKDKLAEVVGNQPYVANNGHFFVFCADLNRIAVSAAMENKDVTPALQSTEKFMVSLIDAALAAQNAAIAAESMDLGICYIGGIRNQLEDVQQILKTPEYVIPLFGLAVGYPAKINDQKPRLPLEHVYMENEYQQDEDVFKRQLEDYNQIISTYYKERTAGKREDTWTGQMVDMLGQKARMYMKDFVQKQKMDLR
ncbi:oxygen-insensitive NADPH nitroreductase [Mesobacillus maritimus]|uniref:oxygen-insensitive NADPH nitroreductase n=1 Tax=Mesobacillus maritimus TaxID=1643336 RepID=UPI00203F1EE6|nr:oxygen-insensitive NADPH nitroreductase [Mesobacillus maritimus]MCM3588940.1 oxygen-insensitive NADPH nitroreductase [Mesobacillus maritimus]MCM3672153.1 oxygen-insensitive NADPH nitroreductase [Mesobacillus maritimus]